MKNGYFANKMNEIVNIERQIKGKGQLISDNLDKMSPARLKKVCEEIHKLCNKAIQKLQELTEKGPDKLQARCIDDEGQLILHLQTSNYVVLRDLNMKKD